MAESRSASTQGRVLVLDTNGQRAEELCNGLRFLNYEPVTAQSGQDLAEMADDPALRRWCCRSGWSFVVRAADPQEPLIEATDRSEA